MAHAVYVILFLGLPVVGIWLHVRLLAVMTAAQIATPPVVPLFWVFAAYGMILLYIVSACCGEWSGMHSLGLLVLFFVLPVWMPIQEFLWRRTMSYSTYHHLTVALSFGFPFVTALLLFVCLAADGFSC